MTLSLHAQRTSACAIGPGGESQSDREIKRARENQRREKKREKETQKDSDRGREAERERERERERDKERERDLVHGSGAHVRGDLFPVAFVQFQGF